MFARRLQERVPSAEPIAIGKLKGHVLRWDKRSQRDGSGKCDAEATGRARDSVWGVTAAHDRTYITQQIDIDDIKARYRKLISELLVASGLKT